MKKQNGYTAVELLIVIVVLTYVFLWGKNIYNITQFPEFNQWKPRHVVAVIGVPIAPVGIICGAIHCGSEE